MSELLAIDYKSAKPCPVRVTGRCGRILHVSRLNAFLALSASVGSLLFSVVRCRVLLFPCCCFWVCRSCCWFVAWCFLLCWCLFCCPAPLWCLVVRFCPCVGAFPRCACFSLSLSVCSCWLVSVGGSSAESAICLQQHCVIALLKSVNVKKYD